MYVYKTFILCLRHLYSNTLTHTKHKLEFIHDNTIKDTLLKDEDVNDLTKELINTANDVSGRDNISVILIEEK